MIVEVDGKPYNFQINNRLPGRLQVGLAWVKPIPESNILLTSSENCWRCKEEINIGESHYRIKGTGFLCQKCYSGILALLEIGWT